jgi:hypothetical protein
MPIFFLPKLRVMVLVSAEVNPKFKLDAIFLKVDSLSQLYRYDDGDGILGTLQASNTRIIEYPDPNNEFK